MEEQSENIEDFEVEEQSTLLSHKMKKFLSNRCPKTFISVQTKAQAKSFPKENIQIKSLSLQSSQIDRKPIKRQYKLTKFSQYYSQQIVIKSEYENQSNQSSSSPLNTMCNQQGKRKSRFFTPQKKQPLTFKFIKVIKRRSSSRDMIIQDKKSTFSTLNGEGFLCMSDGIKIKGRWSQGQPVGELLISKYGTRCPVGLDEDERPQHLRRFSCIQTSHLQESQLLCNEIEESPSKLIIKSVSSTANQKSRFVY